MTAETDLLPMPKPLPRVLVHVLHEGDMELEAVGNYYAAEQVRACVSSATEALRAEVERLKAVAHGFVDEIADKDRRAERLAEALRDVMGWVSTDNYFTDEPMQALARARAALNRTAEQENDDA